MNKHKSCSQFVYIKNRVQLKPLGWRTNSGSGKAKNSIETQDTGSYAQRKDVLSQIKAGIPNNTDHSNPTSIKQNKLKSRLNGFIKNCPKIFLPNLQTVQDDHKQQRITLKRYIIKNPQQKNQSKHVMESGFLSHSQFIKKVSKSLHKTKLDFELDDEEILMKTEIAMSNKSKLLGIIFLKKYGLRFKLSYCFLQQNKKIKQEKYSENVKQKIKQLQGVKHSIYFFHLNKQPIYRINQQISQSQNVLFVNYTPILNLDFQYLTEISAEAKKMQLKLKEAQQIMKKQLEWHRQRNNKKKSSSDEQRVYDWQKIKDIKNYVDNISQFPQIVQQKDIFPTNSIHLQKVTKNQAEKKQRKNITKNFLLETVCHYPDENEDKRLLNKISQKLQKFSAIQNPHNLKGYKKGDSITIKNIGSQQKKQDRNKNKKFSWRTQKDYMWQINRKNRVLSSQNIPYIMQKYGMTRAQAYNVFNIYKSLQKISAMRVGKDNFHQVLQKGLDLQTFSQGLNALEINPGQDLLKNICRFPKFISWQQFLKIISICLRKTPEQKLNAILQSVGGNSGHLTEKQVDAMVGTSLKKLLNQDDVSLRQYFVSIVMQELDTNKNGEIPIQVLKNKVLGQNNQQMDITAFLMLNI